MANFKENPILNSPYHEPTRHWEMDADGRPVQIEKPQDGRRRSKYILPVAPVDPKQSGGQDLGFTTEEGENNLINKIRAEVQTWQSEAPFDRGVTTTTEDLLNHWRGEEVEPRLFFCQLEAVETLIWLNEVAPHTEKGKKILQDIKDGNATSGSPLFRIASKMATGSGKTTVMALLIAYHACNAVRHPALTCFARHFLVITPGITVRDRLRVLLPSYAENYYEAHQFLPYGWMNYMNQAKVVITHYHKFVCRKSPLTAAAKRVLRGHRSEAPIQEESKQEMLRRVWDSNLPKEKVLVINDEAHHCYRNKVLSKEERKRINKEGKDTKDEVKKNNEAARLWINGIEDLEEETGLHCVYDLSATPSFLRGSGWDEETLFPWVVSDFSLMDAIESGIVKIPRLPVRDNTKAKVPIYRELYKYIRDELPKRVAKTKKERQVEPHLPTELLGAMEALYQNYDETAQFWEKAENTIPPVFIIVCSNTTISDLIYRNIAGYWDEERGLWIPGNDRLPRFNNIDTHTGKPHPQPHTILVDSYQMASGGPVSDEFKVLAKALDESNKAGKRTDSNLAAMSNEELLREVLNTVGKQDHLGEQVRCVVSVSMLTEGWDAQNVTHILGVRAFGTQLLCEQVVGRALRRRTYDDFEDENDKTDSEGRKVYRPQYADVFGVPFSFARGSKITAPMPNPTSRIRALRERREMEIEFPHLSGYRLSIPDERLRPDFSKDREEFTMRLNPEDAPTRTDNAPIVGKNETLTLDHLDKIRPQQIVYYLAGLTAKKCYGDEAERIAPQRGKDLIPIVEQWIETCVICHPDAKLAFLHWPKFGEIAAEKIALACGEPYRDDAQRLRPIPWEHNPTGTSTDVDFLTGKKLLFKTTKSHVNLASCDSGEDWEMKMCALLEDDPRVLHYANNDHCRGGLRFSVPYTHARQRHSYYPDFIAVIDDGNGPDDPLNLVIEIKGRRDRKAEAKAETMNTLWVPAVNNDGRWGRWAFSEMLDPQDFQRELNKLARGGV